MIIIDVLLHIIMYLLGLSIIRTLNPSPVWSYTLGVLMGLQTINIMIFYYYSSKEVRKMNLDDEELAYEKLRRNFTKYNQYINKKKDVPFDIYKQMYDDLCSYMDSYNSIVSENEILTRMIELMATNLTSPITDEKWIIKYYREKVIEEKGIEDIFNKR